MNGAQTPLHLRFDEWSEIRELRKEQFGIKGILNMALKRDEGWTYRSRDYGEDVHIDFWDDSSKSMFLLKYSHFIPKSLKTLNKNSG